MSRTSEAARPYFQAFYQNNRLWYAGALLLLLLGTPANLVASWMLGEILDVITAGDMGRLWRMIRFAAVFCGAVTLVDLGMRKCRSAFIHRALAQYKSLAFSRLSEKSISAFSRENTGRYLSVLTNDVNTLEENYLNRSMSMLNDSLLFLGGLAMMFWYSWRLALAAVLLSVLPVVVTLTMGGELSRREKAVSDRNEDFVSQVKDLLSGFSVIKSFKAEREAQALFDRENRETESTKERRRRWEGLLMTVSGALCGGLLQFGVFLLGAWLAIRGEITAGTVLVMVNLCNFVLEPIRTLPQYWAGRKAAMALVEKLAEVTAQSGGRGGEKIPPVLEDAIELSRLSYAYEPGKPVLREISFRLAAGKRYALVGASGSGKSTLLSLLMGADGGYTGSIRIDGRELRQVDTDSLYELMSLIGQNVFLFNDTLWRNITMFRDFPAEQVRKAVKESGLTQLVSQKGKDYVCGENGGNLSGGERQRVSIARSLLRGTPVLLLDEATASLDARTAREVTEAILELEGLTRLVVTHRLEAPLLARYDEILVLRNGTLWEQGSFQELMEKGGYFFSLYTVSNG